METRRILIFYKSSKYDIVGRFYTMQSVGEMLGVAAGTTTQGVSPGAGTDPAPPDRTNSISAFALGYQLGTVYISQFQKLSFYHVLLQRASIRLSPQLQSPVCGPGAHTQLVRS